MSRPLVVLALAVLLATGIAPIAVMFVRLFTAEGELAGLLDGRTLELLGRTTLLGTGAAAIALGIGLPFGFLTARTDVPGASILRPVGLVPLMLPPVLLAMTWTAMAPLRGASMTVVLMGAATFPLVAIFSARAWERIDARREEAALLAGGPRSALQMELPLVLPAAMTGACFAFVFAINDFAVPDFVSSVGPKFNVYSDEIFATWNVTNQDARAVATALPLVVLTLAALLPALALRRRGAMATVDSDFVRPEPLALGAWRWPAFAFCALVVGVAALVPLGRLVFEVGLEHHVLRLAHIAGAIETAVGAQGLAVEGLLFDGRLAAGPGWLAPAFAGLLDAHPDTVKDAAIHAGRSWTTDGARAAFAGALDLNRENLRSTVVFAVSAATVATPVALVLGHAIERGRRGRWLEPLVVLPIAVPAILFGIGNIVLWHRPATEAIYSGGALIVLMMVGRFLAFPILVSSGAVASLDPRLEEAAELSGVGPARRLSHVVAPSLPTAVAGGWTLVFVLAMRELDSAILVPAANDTIMFCLFQRVHFGRTSDVAALALLVVFVILLPGLLWSLFARRRMEVLP